MSYADTNWVCTTTPFGWNESPACYHAFSEATAVYPSSRGIPVLAYIDVAWYENLPPTFGCFDKVQWLSSAEPFTWECSSRVLAIDILFYFGATCCRKPMRREAVEDTTVPRHPVRFETTSFRVPVGKLQKFTLFSVVKLAGRCSIDGAPVSFSADGEVPSLVITPTHQSKIAVRAAQSADRVLSSATGTALTRVAGEGRRQPCRGGRVHSYPRVASRVIRATGGPGFRAVPARCADGRRPVGRRNH